ETAGYARGPSAAEPVSDDFVARECPNLIEAAPFFQEKHWDATFDYGVDALLAGTVERTDLKSKTARSRIKSK
ncbi:MAG TPA: hypothetical protein VFS24_18000, partial [Steroidobacteraceae bacterium]|nr:hypothetical protein [Steroidobacteraceae bacterium]